MTSETQIPRNNMNKIVHSKNTLYIGMFYMKTSQQLQRTQ